MLLALALGAGAILYIFDPATHAFYPFCPLNRFTGLLCPGCGSLRALHNLLHGEIALAFRSNALLLLSLPVLALWAGRAFLARFNPRFRCGPVRAGWFWAAIALIILFGLVRNLPFACLSWLRP